MRQTSFFTALACCAGFALAPAQTRAADQAVLDAQKKRVEVVEKAAASVVAIFAKGGAGGGSGVLISPDGYALSNYHVTSGAGEFMKCGLNDGKLYDAVIVGVDPTGDVALLKLLGRDDFPHAPLGDSDMLRQGDWTYAMGNPFLLATDFSPTVTFGIVSGVHRYQYPAGNNVLEYTDCIQVDTSINPGNSGGPLFNIDGELVGINGRGSFEKRGRVNSGAGYAISINQIKHFMDHLKSGRIVDHATLGATVSTDNEGSVVVNSILDESDAFRRGLRLDDEIVEFAGRPITTVNQFKNVLGVYPKGWTLPLVYRNENQKYEIQVRLRGVHRKTAIFEKKEEVPVPGQPKKRPDGKKPEDGKPKPPPEIQKMLAKAPKPPEKYKHMFVKKEGYANYYFNKLQQDRLKQHLDVLGDFSDAKGNWKFTGKAAAAGNPSDFTLELKSDLAYLETAGNKFIMELDKDATDAPPGTGGMLIAMEHLKMLLTGEPFTEYYYLGGEPLDGTGEVVDVLVTVKTGVESRWYFNQADGALKGVDTWLFEDAEECVIRFKSFKEFEGRRLPEKFTVASGDVEFAKFTVEAAELAPKK